MPTLPDLLRLAAKRTRQLANAPYSSPLSLVEEAEALERAADACDANVVAARVADVADEQYAEAIAERDEARAKVERLRDLNGALTEYALRLARERDKVVDGHVHCAQGGC